VSPDVRANYLASPPLVVAYAIAGTIRKDITTEPLGHDQIGNPIYLKDIWPSNADVAAAMKESVTSQMFQERYADVFAGTEAWQKIEVATGMTYDWKADSTYVRQPPFFEGLGGDLAPLADIEGANLLALLGDSITTDHISPAGSIKKNGPAGAYLTEHGVAAADFNSYGSRRGNHEVMMRGTFANIRIRNEMAPGTEGGVTTYIPTGEVMSIYDASMKYQAEGTPLVVVAGKEYGTGSSRDWAAKGTRLLGVKAVIAESFERIHRSNLVGMGVLPLVFKDGETRQSLGLTGKEKISLTGLAGGITPRMDVACTITFEDGSTKQTTLTCRIDTLDEVSYYRNGGILQYVLKNLAKAA
jgi:aconitate hydratase